MTLKLPPDYYPRTSTVIPLEQYFAATLKTAKHFKVRLMVVPEFGFCHCCQAVYAVKAETVPGYIDKHADDIRPLWMGACAECVSKVSTDSRWCYIITNGIVVHRWMPMQTRN